MLCCGPSKCITSGPIPTADAIVVLGGVAGPAFLPQPIVHLGCDGDRLVYAAKLYQEGKAPVVVVSGGVMQWDKSLGPESEQTAELLRVMGVPASAILQETDSRDSHENAPLVKQLLAAHHLRRILLVTSAATMPHALLHHPFGEVNGKRGEWGHAIGGMGAPPIRLEGLLEAEVVCFRQESLSERRDLERNTRRLWFEARFRELCDQAIHYSKRV